MRIEAISQDNGTASIRPNTPVRVGDTGTWTVTYTAGERGISIGGEVKFTLPYLFGGPHELEDSHARSYITVACSNPAVALETRVGKSGAAYYRESGFSFVKQVMAIKNDKEKRTGSSKGTNIYVKVLKSALKQGDSINLVYGDTSFGGPGAYITSSREIGYVDIYIATDADGKRGAPYNGFYRISELPRLDIRSSPAKTLEVVVPSILSDKTSCPVLVTAYDGIDCSPHVYNYGFASKYGKVATEYTGLLQYECNGQSGEISISPQDKGSRRFDLDLKADQQGYGTVTVTDRENLLIARSNAFTREKFCDYNLYWGDLHIMTGNYYCPQSLSTDDYYEYARDVAGLDFASVTDLCREAYVGDTDGCVNGEEWAAMKEASHKYYKPNEFVTFPAYEYNDRYVGGDRNVYFFDEQEAELFCWCESRYSTPEKLWDALKGKTVMTIPHHPASWQIGQNWDHHSPSFQRLVEIYSSWGNSEAPGCSRPLAQPADYLARSVQSALARGYRLGIIASTDTHNGQVGGVAKVAVWAKSLTREDIWDALWQRRCYATTGERTILHFSLNNHVMGEEIKMNVDQPRQIKVKVIGTAKIEEIQIIRNNQIIYTQSGKRQLEELEYVDKDDRDSIELAPLLFYYIRVKQADGWLAWSSPIWVD